MEHESNLSAEKWPEDTLRRAEVSLDRAADVHEVVNVWRDGHVAGELAYRTLAAIYWANDPHDNDATRFYQADMMQRLAYDAELDADVTAAIQQEALDGVKSYVSSLQDSSE